METERLILRPFREEDLDNVYIVSGDSETMSFYPKPYSKEEVAGIVEKNIRTFKTSRYGLFAVMEKHTSE